MVGLVEVDAQSRSSQGSGFLYQVLSPHLEAEEDGPRLILSISFVTNRHVVFGLPEDERSPEHIRIRLRHFPVGQDEPEWHVVSLDATNAPSRVLVHPDPNVDVALIDITPELAGPILSGQRTKDYVAMSSGAWIANQDHFDPGIGDDVLVVGFPGGFHDETNCFPIAKQGIIASAWGLPFEGEHFFLIDAKLLPGSSGSIVLSKPIDAVVKDGKQYFASEGKNFALLGIYSGEPYLELSEADEYSALGICWYGDIVDQILDSGTRWSQEQEPSTVLGDLLRPKRKRH